jgi:hypothetical protein
MFPFLTPALMVRMAIRSQLLALDWQRRMLASGLAWAAAFRAPPLAAAPATAEPAPAAGRRPRRRAAGG